MIRTGVRYRVCDPGAGEHVATFEPRGLASGIYLYRLTAGEFSDVRKLVLLR